MNHTFDIVILTDKRYIEESYPDVYSQNVVNEDMAILKAMESAGLRTTRTYWDNPDFDWGSARYLLFRSTWDYFDRFDEFSTWLEKVSRQSRLINPAQLIYWNIDKFYLRDISDLGVRIPPTLFVEKGTHTRLAGLTSDLGWEEYVIKPAISGAARHTYRFLAEDMPQYEEVFSELIAGERMLIQQFQHHILTKGEVAFMVFGGRYSHAVQKIARKGDFRVQDNFGGTVHHYNASKNEIEFVEKTISSCPLMPVYARVDALWDNNGDLCLGELEIIEPELWFRMDTEAAVRFTEAVKNYIS